MVDWTPAERIEADAYRLRAFIEGGAHAEALGMCHRLSIDLVAVTATLAQAAFDSGLTKKRIAAILGVPASTLRDLQRTKVRA